MQPLFLFAPIKNYICNTAYFKNQLSNSNEMFTRQKFLTASAFIILSIFLFCQESFSFSIVRIPANEIKPEIKDPGNVKASVFVNLSAKEFAVITGKKLNFFERIYFKAIQRQIKRDLKKNPDLLINDYFDPKKKVKFKLDPLWFVIAAIIGPFGILLVYISHQQKKVTTTRKDRITSAWLGFLFFVLWFGFLFLF